MWLEVSADQRQELLHHAVSLGVLGPLLQMLEQHPQADSEEILVRWQGQAGFEDIQRLAQRKSLLEPAEQQREFVDGVSRILQQRKGRPEVAEIRARAAVNEPQAAVSEVGLPPEQDPFAELGIDPDDYSDSEYPL